MKLIVAICAFVGAYGLAWRYWEATHQVQFTIGGFGFSGALIVAIVVTYCALKAKD